MPFCEIVLEGKPVMSSPLNKMRPEVGRRTPVRQVKKVLLPAPFGPMMARISPRFISKLMRLSAASPPKRTASISVRKMEADAAPRSPEERASIDSSALNYAAGNLQAGGTKVLS